MASQMAVLLEKIDHLEEMAHATNTRVAVIETKVGTILENMGPLKLDVDKVKEFNTNLKGKLAIITVMVSGAVGFLFSLLGRKI